MYHTPLDPCEKCHVNSPSETEKENSVLFENHVAF